ncbi:unnamed protein product [Mortierella alpina]
MVEEFAKDAVKGSSVIKEVVLLGPVLGREHYRSLLSCFITKFDQSMILDVDLLHGLVQLMQCASAGYLVEDDLVKIMGLLRARLQNTHQQSSVHPYHLTLALSRTLDVMAKHEVKDVDRVEQHEPLAAILSSLRDSSDPFLMYQAAYAFQALQCIPDNETALQAVMRRSGAVAEGLISISGIVNLDLGGFLEGITQVQKTIVDTIGIAKAAYEGARSLIESGQDVFSAVKNGISSGNKRAWYPAIVGAEALVREGRLADFKVVVLKATCRSSHEFQWGISQLLGQIALDYVWESAVRQQAVDFLIELYTNDATWGQDTSVRGLMMTILNMISDDVDPKIEVPAGWNKQNPNSAEPVKLNASYPLISHLPLPDTWSLLSRVQGITNVERDIHRLRKERLEDYNQNVYIPPLAKPSLQASDKDALPLMDKVNGFLRSDQHVFLVLGDSGAGKSTFNRHVEHELWEAYKHGDNIPLFINLPAIKQPDQDLIDKQLRIHKFSDSQIQELKQHRRIILICDGYDETQVKVNLHTANLLNQKGQPDTKMIISCRSSHLGSDYRNLFQPQQNDRYNGVTTSLFTEAVIVPFSSAQVEDYVCQFVRDSEVHKLTGDGPIWSTEEYMTKLQSIPNMMELVKNPFLLKLALKALPKVVKDAVDLANVKVTRLTLYDSFISQWLDTNKLRLETMTLSGEADAARRDLLEDGFVQSAIDFSKDLAAAIFREQDGNPVVQYTARSDRARWKGKFFCSQADITILRESSPLSRAGVQHQFIHRSLLEYFYSRHIHETHAAGGSSIEGSQCVAEHPMSQTNLVKEPSIIDFLAEHVKRDADFKQRLHQIIELSKTDGTASRAAANAITTLVRAGVTFNEADLRGIQIPGADLSGGQFDSARLQGADLSGTNLRSVWLRQADLSEAHMAGAQFGEWPFLQEESEVNSCAYSPDGKTLAVGLEDGTISVYQTSTWRRVHTLSGHTGTVNSVVFSPSGQQIASGSDDTTVRLWDAQTGTSDTIFSGHTDWVRSVAVSPSGELIASGSDDTTVRLWFAQTGAPSAILSGHSSEVVSVAFSPDGRQIASGSMDKTERLWDAQTGVPGAIMNGHSSTVKSAAFSPSGQQIASGADDKTVRLWDVQTGTPGATLSGHTQGVNSVVFSSNGQQIASGSADTTVRLWDVQTGAPGAIISGHTRSVTSLAFSPSGQQMASGSGDKTVRLWDAQTNTSEASFSGHTDYVRSVAVSMNGLQIASSSDDNTIRIWDFRTGAPRGICTGHTKWVMTVAFSPSGQQIASGSQDMMVRLWDAETGASVAISSGHTDVVTSVMFSPNGQQMASSSSDGTVRLWDIQTGAPGAILTDHAQGVRSVAFSPSGQQIASCSGDKTVRLWDVQTGEPGAILSGHTDWVNSVVFSPNGQQIASASDDKTVRLWDVQTGEPGAIFSGHSGEVLSVSFSLNGQQLASGSRDTTVRLWDMETGQCLTVVKGFLGGVAAVAWITNRGDNYLVTGCYDNSVRLWKITENHHRVCLQWSSGRSQLSASDTNLQNTRGLSRANIKLLQQGGSLGDPVEPCDDDAEDC